MVDVSGLKVTTNVEEEWNHVYTNMVDISGLGVTPNVDEE